MDIHSKMKKEEIAEEFKKIQDEICLTISELDGKSVFESDKWTRKEGGGGDTRILQNGNVLEKAGVNFSEVYGPISDKMKSSYGFESATFYATGVSIVMHPENPFIPIIHMNIRYFELPGKTWWFGGGIDLTPIYVDEQEAKYFHQRLKDVCDAHHPEYYSKFKTWADDYFYIPHRNETRGIGGIFFDHLKGDESEKAAMFKFVCDVGRTFASTYSEIINRKRHCVYNDRNKEWQSIRRSRYVEFNLVYDRGTKFGLESDGRVESILMSMPPVAKWHYNLVQEAGSEEEKTLNMLKKGKAWV